MGMDGGNRGSGGDVDFGRTAGDYRTHRAGFPSAFFAALLAKGWVRPSQSALDLGTGTGTVSRGLAQAGLSVIATDPSPAMLGEACGLDREAGVSVDYRHGPAEAIDLPAAACDVVTAGQCWHWFDRPRAAAEIGRVLKPGGRVVIAHFDWLPLAGNVVAETEALILRHNPAWAMAGGTGLYPLWLADLAVAGFTAIETFSFDVAVPYSNVGWRGRIRASAGVKASLSAEATDRFDRDLARLLADRFPADPLAIPHRIWAVGAVTA